MKVMQDIGAKRADQAVPRTYCPNVADDRLLSTGEAARALGLSSRSLARWAKEGQVTPALTTPGGQYRFNLDDLRAEIRAMPKRDEE